MKELGTFIQIFIVIMKSIENIFINIFSDFFIISIRFIPSWAKTYLSLKKQATILFIYHINNRFSIEFFIFNKTKYWLINNIFNNILSYLVLLKRFMHLIFTILFWILKLISQLEYYLQRKILFLCLLEFFHLIHLL